MSISKQNDLKHFILVQILCQFCYLFFVLMLFILEYQILEFLYCFPIILFLQITYYFVFWHPSTNCLESFLLISIPLFVIETSVFLGVYFGYFGKTLQYSMQEVNDCLVIGKQSVQLPFYFDDEIYTILYVDFQMDNQQMLGYSCLSSRLNGGVPNSKFTEFPNSFSFYGERYKFSQVKLPSWFCLSEKTAYEYLKEKRNCYVYFYPNNSNSFNSQAYQNSLNREQLRDISEFALVTYKKLPVPYDDYFCLLVFGFCPLIPSLSIFFIGLIDIVLIEVKRKKIRWIKFQSNKPKFDM